MFRTVIRPCLLGVALTALCVASGVTCVEPESIQVNGRTASVTLANRCPKSIAAISFHLSNNCLSHETGATVDYSISEGLNPPIPAAQLPLGYWKSNESRATLVDIEEACISHLDTSNTRIEIDAVVFADGDAQASNPERLDHIKRGWRYILEELTAISEHIQPYCRGSADARTMPPLSELGAKRRVLRAHEKRKAREVGESYFRAVEQMERQLRKALDNHMVSDETYKGKLCDYIDSRRTLMQNIVDRVTRENSR